MLMHMHIHILYKERHLDSHSPHASPRIAALLTLFGQTEANCACVRITSTMAESTRKQSKRTQLPQETNGELNEVGSGAFEQ